MGGLLPNVVLLDGEVHPPGTQDQTPLSLWNKSIAKPSSFPILLFSHWLLHTEQLLAISCLQWHYVEGYCVVESIFQHIPRKTRVCLHFWNSWVEPWQESSPAYVELGCQDPACWTASPALLMPRRVYKPLTVKALHHWYWTNFTLLTETPVWLMINHNAINYTTVTIVYLFVNWYKTIKSALFPVEIYKWKCQF